MRFARFLLFSLVVVSALLVSGGPAVAAGATLTVNSTGDTNSRDGTLTLREAILLATSTLSVDTLDSGECAQVSASTYGPPCSTTDTIGATSADTINVPPGTITLVAPLQLSSGNDTVMGAGAALSIVDGVTKAFNCFFISGETPDNNAIKGLQIERCSTGIVIAAGADGSVVGGGGAGERNVIHSNTYGVDVSGSATSGSVIAGNYIGTDAAGSTAMPNSIGVLIYGAAGTIVGGDTGNVISGNTIGVQVSLAASGSQLLGNLIGTQPDGKTPLGNASHGVYVFGGATGTAIGMGAIGQNTIAYNGGDGVRVDGSGSTGNAVRGNSIHSNGGLGIDIGPDGATANDAGDADTGPNNLQNFPVLSSAKYNGISTTVYGSLNSTALTTFQVAFYSNATCDASGYGEGGVYLGRKSVKTDSSGNISFQAAVAAAPGEYVTAVAVDPAGNTSEFSACRLVSPGASTVRASEGLDGAPGDAASSQPAFGAGGGPGAGRYLAFVSEADNLVAGDTNGVADVFLYDQLTGDLQRVSLANDEGQLMGLGTTPSVSGDGRFVAFVTDAPAVPEDTNALADVYLRDALLGITVRVSLANDEGQLAGFGTSPSVSGDSRFVAFVTDTPAVPEDTNGLADVYLRDVLLGTTVRVSVANDEGQLMGFGTSPTVSGDGRFVAFVTDAPAVPGDTNGTADAYVRDVQTGMTALASLADDGSPMAGIGTVPSWPPPVRISADGRFVSFTAPGSPMQAYVRDLGDTDGDGAWDPFDNCLSAANPGQENFDGDSLGDFCDADDDNDGALDTIDVVRCEGDPFDSGKKPERTDGIFAGVDDDGDTLIDEALSAGAANFDCDGDGWSGTREAGTPLCGNGVNDDGVIFGGSDDGDVDDGCPGGPAQVGAYSEAQFNIGLGDQDPCGNNGWPADLWLGDNKVTLADVTSFTTPAASRKFGTSPGNPNFSSRWDLVPGGGAAGWINLADITSLTVGTTSRPPMLGGVRAFGGPVCPWPG